MSNRVSCRKCYPLIKKLEESEKRIVLEKKKNQKLKSVLKNTKKKLVRSRKTIKVFNTIYYIKLFIHLLNF